MSRVYEFPEEAGLEAAKAHCEEMNQKIVILENQLLDERVKNANAFNALDIKYMNARDELSIAKMILQEVASDDGSRYNRPNYYRKVVDFLNKL